MFLLILFFISYLQRDCGGKNIHSTNTAMLVLKMLYSNTEVSAGD